MELPDCCFGAGRRGDKESRSRSSHPPTHLLSPAFRSRPLLGEMRLGSVWTRTEEQRGIFPRNAPDLHFLFAGAPASQLAFLVQEVKDGPQDGEQQQADDDGYDDHSFALLHYGLWQEKEAEMEREWPLLTGFRVTQELGAAFGKEALLRSPAPRRRLEGARQKEKRNQMSQGPLKNLSKRGSRMGFLPVALHESCVNCDTGVD